MTYTYTYLFIGGILLVAWLVVFFLRKDTRKQQLIMSCLFAPLAFLSNIAYTTDWWAPQYALGFDIESWIVGFALGGVLSVISMHLLRIQNVSSEVYRHDTSSRIRRIAQTFVIGSFSFLGAILLGFHSFHATVIMLLVLLIVLFVERSDLFLISCFTGILALILMSFAYIVANILTPNWVSAFYVLSQAQPVIMAGLPVESVVYYYFVGMLIGPLYAYWNGYDSQSNHPEEYV